jgi:hypothetical protein
VIEAAGLQALRIASVEPVAIRAPVGQQEALPSPERDAPIAATKQNTAKLHIPGKNPRRNWIALDAPCWACVTLTCGAACA